MKHTKEFSHPIKKSIKKRVIAQVSALIGLALFVMIGVVSLLIHKHMTQQMEVLLHNDSSALQQRIEQRLRYLIENSVLLTKNEFMINALIDAKNRENYLPPIVANFMDGKDVISLSVVDFDGAVLYKTREDIPSYKSSKELRASLALGYEVIYLDPLSHDMILIAPIEYYETTQGAIIVLFDMQEIIKRNVALQQELYLRVFDQQEELYHYNYNENTEYFTQMLSPSEQTPLMKKLSLNLELGVAEESFLEPVQETLTRLFIIGVVFLLFGFLFSFILADTITKPILKLYNRIKQSNEEEDVLCFPLGTDDELEALAKVFDEHTLALQYQAKHDSLTSLPNRVLFIDRLEQAIRNAKHNDKMVAVLFIDLDRFKEVNDSFGHTIGDKLLKDIGILLKDSISEVDTIARLGGDEFTVLIENIAHENKVIDLIHTIMDRLKEVRTIDQYQFYVSCSIGISLYPQNASSAEEMLQNADAAMYRAKDEGRNTYQFYTQGMTQRAYERVTLETRLREAIAAERFEVYFQPQIDMRDGSFIGMEALVRWIEDGEFVAGPDKFIPLAEDTRMIIDLDRYVMRTAIAQFANWKAQGYKPGKLSLNMSMVHLNSEDFTKVLLEMLQSNNMQADAIELEVTETQIMRNPEQTIERLHQIRSLGFSIAVDDFGTGHSSLAYLKKLPLTRLKIDQSFIRDIPKDSDDVELTRTIIAMGQNLNLNVIAEGVETQEHATFLQEYGCFNAQGYFYYKPMKISDVEKELKGKI